jgi:hypothetical protein
VLYGRCGRYLHRGSLNRLLGEPIDFAEELKNIERHTKRIINLLGYHLMHLFDGTLFVGALQSQGQPLAVRIAEKRVQGRNAVRRPLH